MRGTTSISLIALSLCSASGCVSRASYEAEHARLAETQARLAGAQKQVIDLKNQVEASQRNIAARDANPPGAFVRADSVMRIPVTLSFRRAEVGPGYTAVLANKEQGKLLVRVLVVSHSTWAIKKFRIAVPARGECEIGYYGPTEIEDGDEIKVSNPDFATLEATFHPDPAN